MHLFINRRSTVPIHDQLCAQIGQLAASGSLTPDERLPSIRGLAVRLGIHHNTVAMAYKTLAEQGILTIRPGSGVRIAPNPDAAAGWREGVALRALAAHFVAHARSRGHEPAAILAACQAALTPGVVSELIVVNPHEDLQALYLHELAQVVHLPMRGMMPEDVAVLPADAKAAALFLTSLNHAPRLREILGQAAEPLIFRLTPPEPMLDRVRAVPKGDLVVIVSESHRFRAIIPDLLAGLLDPDHVVAVAPSDRERFVALRGMATLLVADARCAPALAMACPGKVFTYPLLSEHTLPALAERLPPEAFRPSAGSAVG